VEAVTMRPVAEEVGITPMAIYHHFPSRDALLRSITNGEFQRLLQFSLRRLRAGQLEPVFLNILEGHLYYAIAYPHLFNHFFFKPQLAKVSARFPPTQIADSQPDRRRLRRLQKRRAC
jgi:AcrR family transcriptional regulator